MSFSSDVFSIERDGHVATLWLDRPEKRLGETHPPLPRLTRWHRVA